MVHPSQQLRQVLEVSAAVKIPLSDPQPQLLNPPELVLEPRLEVSELKLHKVVECLVQPRVNPTKVLVSVPITLRLLAMLEILNLDKLGLLANSSNKSMEPP